MQYKYHQQCLINTMSVFYNILYGRWVESRIVMIAISQKLSKWQTIHTDTGIYFGLCAKTIFAFILCYHSIKVSD